MMSLVHDDWMLLGVGFSCRRPESYTDVDSDLHLEASAANSALSGPANAFGTCIAGVWFV